LTAFSEILLCVINNPICANRTQHAQLLCTVYSSDFSPQRLGHLHSKCTNTSTCTINQNLLSALDIASSHKIRSFKSTNRKRSGFLIGHVGRFDGQRPILRQTFVLSISPQTKTAPPHNLVTLPEPRDLFADRLNFSGQLLSQDRDSWS